VVVNDTSRAPSFFSTPPILNVNYTEGASATSIGSGITFNPTDYGDTASINFTASISDGFQSGDVLTTSDFDPLLWGRLGLATFDAETHTYKLNLGSQTVYFNAYAQNLRFASTSDDPTNHGANTTRTITWSINTYGDHHYETTSTINITAVDNAPTINTTQTGYKAAGLDALHLENTGITISDPDSSSLSVFLSVMDGQLSIDPGSTGAIVNQSHDNYVAISGNLSQINSLLAGVTGSIVYDPYLNFTVLGDLLQINVSDGELSSETISLSIDKPSIQGIITSQDTGIFSSLGFESLTSTLNILINQLNDWSYLNHQSPPTASGINKLINLVSQASIQQTFYSGASSPSANYDIGSDLVQLIGMVSSATSHD